MATVPWREIQRSNSSSWSHREWIGMYSLQAEQLATQFVPCPCSLQARDTFYRCLDSTKHKTPTEVGYVGLMYPADCKPARADYLQSCRPTWVKHFDRQYSAQKRLRRLLDQDTTLKGPISLPQASTFINKTQAWIGLTPEGLIRLELMELQQHSAGFCPRTVKVALPMWGLSSNWGVEGSKPEAIASLSGPLDLSKALNLVRNCID